MHPLTILTMALLNSPLMQKIDKIGLRFTLSEACDWMIEVVFENYFSGPTVVPLAISIDEFQTIKKWNYLSKFCISFKIGGFNNQINIKKLVGSKEPMEPMLTEPLTCHFLHPIFHLTSQWWVLSRHPHPDRTQKCTWRYFLTWFSTTCIKYSQWLR